MKSLGPPPYVCLITEGNVEPHNYESKKRQILETVAQAVSNGVGLIQIREKSITVRQLDDLVSRAVEVVGDTGALIVVNDRADVAIAAGASGVHLPEHSIPVDAIRRTFGNDLLIGVSTHTLEAAVSAARLGADFIFFGPIFETPGKGTPVGLDELNRVCQVLNGFPVMALGGIDQHNCRDAIQAGAAGIAAIRALNAPDSRKQILTALGIIRMD